MSEVDLGVLRRRLLIGLAAVLVVAPLVLGAGGWPEWWDYIALEQSPMTWLESMVIVLAATAAGLTFVVMRLRNGPVGARRTWLVVAMGLMYLAFDERFALHERVRDNVLAPRGISVPFLPWIAPGDFLMLVIAIAGLIMLPRVWRALSANRVAQRLLAGGVIAAGVAVGLDSIDPTSLSVDAERLEQTAEEIIELAAGLCFLGAFAMGFLDELAISSGGPPDTATGEAARASAGSAAPAERV